MTHPSYCLTTLVLACTLSFAPTAYGFGIDTSGSGLGGISDLDRNRAALESIAPNFSTDGSERVISDVGNAIKAYDEELLDDVKAIAAKLGIDLGEAMKLLSAQRIITLTSTNLIRDSANATHQTCAKLPSEFRVNCLRQGYDHLAQALPKRGDYKPVQNVLRDVSRDLAKIERASRDRARGRVRLTKSQKSRRYSATLGTALQQAEAAIEKAQSRLLRSVPASDPRAVHYRRIAVAFDKATVLLRS